MVFLILLPTHRHPTRQRQRLLIRTMATTGHVKTSRWDSEFQRTATLQLHNVLRFQQHFSRDLEDTAQPPVTTGEVTFPKKVGWIYLFCSVSFYHSNSKNMPFLVQIAYCDAILIEYDAILNLVVKIVSCDVIFAEYDVIWCNFQFRCQNCIIWPNFDRIWRRMI